MLYQTVTQDPKKNCFKNSFILIVSRSYHETSVGDSMMIEVKMIKNFFRISNGFFHTQKLFIYSHTKNRLLTLEFRKSETYFLLHSQKNS